jgi:hypothetical protein
VNGVPPLVVAVTVYTDAQLGTIGENGTRISAQCVSRSHFGVKVDNSVQI